MKIRKAVLEDASGIAKVHVDSWRTTYKEILPADFLEKLTYSSREELWQNAIPVSDVFVAEDSSGQIVGFATAGEERSDDYPPYDGELYAIYILAEQQNQGIGKKLVQQAVESLKKAGKQSMLVLVLKDNPAIHFYKALGAKEIDAIDI
ncbi:GNAT family N-acetyltransferase [Lysinibacillus sp. 54212]|uniref:GNAT family N-acetyltransferase n=1 Tax=Lysinibacillus sp. 54212 TaxID=3119829 RepID=UPI002FC7CACA